MEVLFCFNFHKVANVRKSYHKIIASLSRNERLSCQSLTTAFTLTIQTLAMENNTEIIEAALGSIRMLTVGLLNQFSRSDMIKWFLD
jgi:hypothetical protein